MGKNEFRRILLAISFAVLLLAVVFRFEDIKSVFDIVISVAQPIIIGFCIAFVLSRPAEFFEKGLCKLFKYKKPKLARGLSIVFVYLILLLFIAALFGVLIPSLADSIGLFVGNLEGYIENLEAIVATLPANLIPDIFGENIIQQITDNFSQLLDILFTGIFPQVFDFTASVGNVAGNTLLGLILSIYIVAERKHLAQQATRLIKAYAPLGARSKIFKVAKISDYVFSKYVVGQLTEAVILGVLCFIGMSVLRFPYASLISVIIGVTNVIPIVGPIIGSVPSAFILLMVDPMSAVWFIIFMIILQQLESNLIYPRVVGGSIGLPGPYVLSGVLVGGGLFGMLGMLLALPVLSVIYQLVKINVEDKETKEQETKSQGSV